ncbi:MAG: AAA family ATPase, partial [Prevotellaceae bacterium]|nr:AAA family ATPase [Prevotellaceae bacterium]
MMENPELELAWNIISNTDTHLFLTGKAGTGKTTFLRELRRKVPKRMIVVAPTGIAAINAEGVTIHSFFQLPFGPQIPGTQYGNNKRYAFRRQKLRLIRTVDLVVIDEISMVRADLLDAIDSVLRQYRDRNRPFGGVQMLMIGDMQQLAPVARDDEWAMLRSYYDTPYFFSSKALQQTDFVTVELQHVYRQSDPLFVGLLNKVRTNTADAETLQTLNQRFIAGFNPPKQEGYIRLVTHNAQADAINQRELEALSTPAYNYDATIWKEFPELSFPTDKTLTLKLGAQVMFIKNDSSQEKRYYNGMIGEVVDIDDEHIQVRPAGQSGIIDVTPEEWQNMKYELDEKTKEIHETVVGTFTQYPLKTAWAITVHKSQGLTFEHAIIDVQHSFAHGQTYVALSRCKSLEGMVLAAPIPQYAIINDKTVETFQEDP